MSSKHILFLLVLFLFPFPIFASVAINEILPNPSGASTEESEFIELYNSGDSSVDLGGWKLDDETDGGSSPYTIASGTAIPAKSYLVFEKSQTNIALNNTGDIVQLVQTQVTQSQKMIPVVSVS